jgi:hypothetical protein
VVLEKEEPLKVQLIATREIDRQGERTLQAPESSSREILSKLHLLYIILELLLQQICPLSKVHTGTHLEGLCVMICVQKSMSRPVMFPADCFQGLQATFPHLLKLFIMYSFAAFNACCLCSLLYGCKLFIACASNDFQLELIHMAILRSSHR